MELDYERATKSSDDGDSKQFMILLLVVIYYLESPEEMAANAVRDGHYCRSKWLVGFHNEIGMLYTFVRL